MATIKYLKFLKTHSVTLYSGRQDFITMRFGPDEFSDITPYYDIVDNNASSINYNEPVIESYIKSNIFCILELTEPEPVIPPPPPPSYSLTYRLRTPAYNTIIQG